MYCDSAAALGITQRAGIGKVRPLRTEGLWEQEVRVSGRIVYEKVLGEKTPADLMTKHMTAELANRHLTTMNMTLTEGRSEVAPTLNSPLQAWYSSDANVEAPMGNNKGRFSDRIQFRAVPAEGRSR